MNFTLSQEQLSLCAEIETLCKTHLNNDAKKDDALGIFPRKKWDICGTHQIMGLPIPQEYGGRGLSMLSTALAIKSLSRFCIDEGLIFSICAHMLTCAVPIWEFGSNDQKTRYLPNLCRGIYIGGNGITESMAGSDVTAIATKVKKNKEFLSIDGSKIFVTNGPIADLLIIYAKHPHGMHMLDISAIIIEKDSADFNIGQVFKKMGLHTSMISEILFNNCTVPYSNILGRERFGMRVFNHSMLWERIIMASYHIGAMEQQFTLLVRALYYKKNQDQIDTHFEIASDILVDMKMRIKSSQLMLFKSCDEYDRGNCTMADAAMIKLIASESKIKNSVDAQKICSLRTTEHSYLLEEHTNLLNKQFRDSIAASIYSGTHQVQKKIIAESIEHDL